MKRRGQYATLIGCVSFQRAFLHQSACTFCSKTSIPFQHFVPPLSSLTFSEAIASLCCRLPELVRARSSRDPLPTFPYIYRPAHFYNFSTSSFLSIHPSPSTNYHQPTTTSINNSLTQLLQWLAPSRQLVSHHCHHRRSRFERVLSRSRTRQHFKATRCR